MEEKEIITRLRELSNQIHILQINLTQVQIEVGNFRQEYLKSTDYRGKNG